MAKLRQAEVTMPNTLAKRGGGSYIPGSTMAIARAPKSAPYPAARMPKSAPHSATRVLKRNSGTIKK